MQFKKILPALALTLMIGGALTANALNGAQQNDPTETWYGVRENQSQVQIDPQNFDPLSDCKDQDAICVQKYMDGVPAGTIDGGPYLN